MRTKQLGEEFDLQLRWTVFPLHPDTPEEGMTLEELFAGRMDVPAVMAHLKTVADELGLPFGERTHTYNSRRAQELGKWAEQQAQGEAFHDALYAAYFVEGRNIAQLEELAAIAESIGLSADEALKVLNEGRFATEVDADWERARSLRVSSVPTYIHQERGLVGFQDYAAFRKLMTD